MITDRAQPLLGMAQWPNHIHLCNRMRTDSQVVGLYAAETLPIRRRKWMIDDNGASDEATEFIARNLGLPIKGADGLPGRARRRDRFNHDQHMYHALLSLFYGAMFFEQVYRFENTDPITGKVD